MISVPRPLTSMLPPSSTIALRLAVDVHIGFHAGIRRRSAISAADRRVELPVVILGPGIETPGRRRDGEAESLFLDVALAANEDRAVVARPHPIGRNAHEADIAGRLAGSNRLLRNNMRADQHFAGLRLGRFVVDQDVDLLDCARDGERSRRRPTGWLRTCRASRSGCAATRSTWLRAAPTRLACDSRARQDGLESREY